MIIGKPFDQINIEDIKGLIAQGVTENQNLEFKRQAWGRNDSEIWEMLKDISSMANKHGGYLIIGIEEDPLDGKAINIISVAHAGEERDRIFASCQSNIDPPMLGLKIETLHDGSTDLIIIYAPYSLRAPHLITFRGRNQFWIRHDRQKFPMSIQEIRESFLKNFNVTAELKEFLTDRRRELIEEATETNQPIYALGAVPINIHDEILDINDSQLRTMLNSAPTDRRGGFNFNFENCARPNPTINGLEITLPNYKALELYRNGYLQAKLYLKEFRSEEENGFIINSYALIEGLYSFAGQVKQISDYLGYQGQFTIFAKLLNIKNHGLQQYITGARQRPGHKIWHNQNLEIPLLTFDNVEPSRITKTLGDRIWQAFGYEREPHGNNESYVF